MNISKQNKRTVPCANACVDSSPPPQKQNAFLWGFHLVCPGIHSLLSWDTFRRRRKRERRKWRSWKAWSKPGRQGLVWEGLGVGVGSSTINMHSMGVWGYQVRRAHESELRFYASMWKLGIAFTYRKATGRSQRYTDQPLEHRFSERPYLQIKMFSRGWGKTWTSC